MSCVCLVPALVFRAHGCMVRILFFISLSGADRRYSFLAGFLSVGLQKPQCTGQSRTARFSGTFSGKPSNVPGLLFRPAGRDGVCGEK